MKPQRKLALRRWTMRKLRKLLDFLDDRLHAEEMRLREDLCGTAPVSAKETFPSKAGSTPATRSNSPAAVHAAQPACAKASRSQGSTATVAGESFSQWEMRRSGVTSLPRKSSRRRGLTARAFDLRFSTR